MLLLITASVLSAPRRDSLHASTLDVAAVATMLLAADQRNRGKLADRAQLEVFGKEKTRAYSVSHTP